MIVNREKRKVVVKIMFIVKFNRYYNNIIINRFIRFDYIIKIRNKKFILL